EPGTPADISTFVQKSGDTMTGDLSGIDPTMPQHLATKAYVDSKISPTLGGKWEYVEDDLTPGTGKFGSDTTSLAAASMLYFAGEDLNGVDFTNFLPLLKVGNTVYIQDANESTKYAAFLMNASPINNDGVVEVSVTYEAGGEIVEDGDKSSVLFFIAGQDAQPPSEEGPHRVPIIEVDIAGMMPSKALCQVAMQDLGLDVNTNVMFFIIDTFGFIKPSYMIHYYKDNQEFYIAMMPKAV
ncbi:MAG: hypothetical protein KAH32_07885, partial [Chlamydiia bacterium]|nr:hypothetical protein [Chlamydiia bacterium]